MVYIILGNGFEEMEAVTPGDLLRRAGVETAYVGIGGMEVTGSHGMTLRADLTVEEMDLTALDMIVLPGGKGGVSSILACGPVLDAVRFAWENEKLVAAVCAAPTVLASLGITEGRNVTCYPDAQWTEKMRGAVLVPDAAAVRDGRLITGTSAGCSVAFGLKLVEAMAGPEAAEKAARAIVLR